MDNAKISIFLSIGDWNFQIYLYFILRSADILTRISNYLNKSIYLSNTFIY